MAKTAVINPRRLPPRGKGGQFRKRYHYGAASKRSKARRRRRNPASHSPYASTGYYRAPNPKRRARRRNPEWSWQELVDILPAATGGVWLGRWAVKQSGAWEAGAGGALEPGIKQAIAIFIAANMGSTMVGQLLNSAEKARVAKIAAYAYGGDLFMRTRFMRDSQFVQQQLSLQGFESNSPLGSGWHMGNVAPATSYTDATGQTWHSTPQGWELAGPIEEGLLMPNYMPEGEVTLEGFEADSELGALRHSRRSTGHRSSFGW